MINASLYKHTHTQACSLVRRYVQVPLAECYHGNVSMRMSVEEYLYAFNGEIDNQSYILCSTTLELPNKKDLCLLYTLIYFYLFMSFKTRFLKERIT